MPWILNGESLNAFVSTCVQLLYTYLNTHSHSGMGSGEEVAVSRAAEAREGGEEDRPARADRQGTTFQPPRRQCQRTLRTGVCLMEWCLPDGVVLVW